MCYDIPEYGRGRIVRDDVLVSEVAAREWQLQQREAELAEEKREVAELKASLKDQISETKASRSMEARLISHSKALDSIIRVQGRRRQKEGAEIKQLSKKVVIVPLLY